MLDLKTLVEDESWEILNWERTRSDVHFKMLVLLPVRKMDWTGVATTVQI